MSGPLSSPRIIQGLLRISQYKYKYKYKYEYEYDGCANFSNSSSSSCVSSPILPTSPINSKSSSNLNSKSIPISKSNVGLSQLLFSSPKPKLTPNFSSSSFASRHSFSFKSTTSTSSSSSDFWKIINRNISGISKGKGVFENPSAAISNAFSRYREAMVLQIEAFCKRNYLFLLGAGGVFLCGLLWRLMFGIANTFVSLSEGMAKYGFLALSSAIVAFAGLYVRSRIMINPDRVYRIAMRRLNTSAGILEVMGAPLTGTELRAYVMSGGGLTLKNFKPRLRSKRCFLIFPIQGSERKGLVSVEVKKKRGQYDMRLLAVDIPMASGPEQRLFLVGDEEEYKVGGGLISELRDPVVKAMAASKEFDDLDQIEEEEDAERELQQAERKHREEIERLEKGGL